MNRAQTCLVATVVLHMLIINVQNKSQNEKFEKASEIVERVKNSFSVTTCVKTKRIQIVF